jgi:arylformamidase
MTIYDITLPITEETITWPGHPAVVIEKPFHLERGDHATITSLCTGLHNGTHVDAPCHFLSGGSGIEALPLEVLIGPAQVVEVGDAQAISAGVLETLRVADTTERLIFHTSNSRFWERGEERFQEDYVALTADGAQWLVDHGVRLVGTDYHSVAPFGDTAPVHRILLAADVVLLETLDMTGVPAGFYQLVCLPLNVVGSDGAPARAVLIADD